jgi:hypothetical protein
MFNRRKLFGFAVAAPAVAFLPNNHVKAEVTKEDTSANAPTGGPILTLQAQELHPHTVSYDTSPYTISFSTHVPVGPQLGVSVGKDGHMWVKINDKWKRVVVE